MGLLFTQYTWVATHYVDKYVLRVKLRVAAVYSCVLNSEQGAVYTLRLVVSMKH